MKTIETDNIKVKQGIKLALAKNEAQYGAPYCPCVTVAAHNEDTICPCKAFRESGLGSCHCGLYIHVEGDENE